MAIIYNVIVQYNGGFLPDIIILFTQAPILIWFDGTIIVYYFYYTTLLAMHYIVFCLFMFGGPAWRLNVSIQYNGGLLFDIILLTQGHYQWGTRLNAM